jgi:voltage-gated sodium channel
VLRALRVLRLFRLLSVVPRMRLVIESLVHAIPGLGSIALLLLLFFYVFAVMATKLFGGDFPDYFGTLGTSLFSLFQIMTLENWPDMAREVMAQYPHAWVFFLVFILLATFTVLNLFIALIVNTMQTAHSAAEATEPSRGPPVRSSCCTRRFGRCARSSRRKKTAKPRRASADHLTGAPLTGI